MNVLEFDIAQDNIHSKVTRNGDKIQTVGVEIKAHATEGNAVVLSLINPNFHRDAPLVETERGASRDPAKMTIRKRIVPTRMTIRVEYEEEADVAPDAPK